jgi:hypothetical protein
MATWRFTLVGLFSAVAIVATACAALANPSRGWTCAVVSGTLTLLSYAVLAAVFRRGAGRAFWIGFSIIGWGYVYLVAHGGLSYSMLIPFGETGSTVVTSKLLGCARETLYGDVDPMVGYLPVGPVGVYDYGVPPVAPPPHPNKSAFDFNNPTLAPADAESDRRPNVDGSAPSDDRPATGYPKLAPGDPELAPDQIYYSTATAMSASLDPLQGQRFRCIGEYLWALVLGLIGGLAARWMQQSGERVRLID